MSQALTDAGSGVRDIDFLGIAVRVHDAGAGEVAEFTGVEGPLAPPHRHAWTETHYVVEGEIEYFVGGATQRISAGGFLTIPGNTVHAVTAVSPRVRWVEVTAAAKPSAFFARVSRDANQLPPDMEKLTPIAAEYGVEVVLA
jgi:quercetin dioxygenase-like cupin family protein